MHRCLTAEISVELLPVAILPLLWFALSADAVVYLHYEDNCVVCRDKDVVAHRAGVDHRKNRNRKENETFATRAAYPVLVTAVSTERFPEPAISKFFLAEGGSGCDVVRGTRGFYNMWFNPM